MAECFQIKKGTVIFFCLLNIAIYIFVAGLAEIVIANEYNVNDNRTQVSFCQNKLTFKLKSKWFYFLAQSYYSCHCHSNHCCSFSTGWHIRSI